MPIYEYEPVDRDCFMCPNRIEVIQDIGAEPYKFCPYCGLDVKKVVSRATFKVGNEPTADKAAKKGFTTYKRAEKGVWEKAAGEGPDIITGTKEDLEAVEAEKAAKPKILDLNDVE
jgi:putative FmdB family regulatory protein